jgi:hypothetical protein
MNTALKCYSMLRRSCPPERRCHDRKHIDYVSIGSLIVSAASLAWTIYADRRKDAPKPDADDLNRAIQDRTGAANSGDKMLQKKITKIVIAEIIQTARDINAQGR